MPLPDVDDLSTLGGEISDYRPVPDPTVERNATQSNAIAGNVAMMTAVAWRAWARCELRSGTQSVLAHAAVWGSTDGVKPTLARTSAGVYTVTWATTQTDALGDSHATSIRCAACSVDSAAAKIAHVAITSANIVTVKVWDHAGVASDLAASESLTVYVG